ncbi:MAG: PAS domain-containing protein, partial [Holosporales bacterium]|nr:PAS domain-containing protein [Holosporales bacterium]
LSIAIVLVIVILAMFRPRMREDYTVSLLQDGNIPWCIIPLDKSGLVEKKSFLCSNEFANIIGARLPSWGMIVNAFDTEGSNFRSGMQNLLKTGESMSIRIVVREKTYEINAKISSARIRASGDHVVVRNVLLTLHDVTEAKKIKERYDGTLEKVNDLLNILNALPFPVWTRKNDGTLTFCNATYAKFLETQPYQVLSHQWELIDGPSAKYAKHLYKEVLANRKGQTIEVKKKLKGEERTYKILEDLVSKVEPYSNEYAIVGAAFDSSRQVEPLKVQDEKLYEDTLNLADWPFCIIDRNGQVVLRNFAFEQLIGVNVSKNESFIHDVLERLREEDKLPGDVDFPKLKKAFSQWLERKNLPFHEMLHMPSGLVINVSILAHQDDCILLTLKDITQTLNIESRYKSLQSVWNSVVDQSKDAILIIGLDHRIHRCSTCVREILDRDSSSLIGISIKDFLRTLVRQHAVQIWKSSLEDAIELRNPHTVTILTTINTLLCEYMPLPDGWHMLRFSICAQEGQANTLFSDCENVRQESCRKISHR